MRYLDRSAHGEPALFVTLIESNVSWGIVKSVGFRQSESSSCRPFVRAQDKLPLASKSFSVQTKEQA